MTRCLVALACVLLSACSTTPLPPVTGRTLPAGLLPPEPAPLRLDRAAWRWDELRDEATLPGGDVEALARALDDWRRHARHLRALLTGPATEGE